MYRGRAVISEPGVEDREMGSTITLEWVVPTRQQSATAARDRYFDSRAGSDGNSDGEISSVISESTFTCLAHWLGARIMANGQLVRELGE
jgi:hypothetical protein